MTWCLPLVNSFSWKSADITEIKEGKLFGGGDIYAGYSRVACHSADRCVGRDGQLHKMAWQRLEEKHLEVIEQLVGSLEMGD